MEQSEKSHSPLQNQITLPDFDKLTMDKQQGLMIYPGKVRVISSERQDKLVICAMD